MFKKIFLILLLSFSLQSPANAGTWHLAPIIDGAGSTWHQLSCNPNFLSQWQPVGCSYSCPNGSLAGQSCIINTTAYIGATLNYYCPWGGYFDGGSTCIVPYTYGASIVGWNYGWSGDYYDGSFNSCDYWGTCYFSGGNYYWYQIWGYATWISWAGNAYYWGNGWIDTAWVGWATFHMGSDMGGGAHAIQIWTAVSPIYGCNGGDWYDGGSTCYSNWYYGAPSYYSCPGGWSLSGSTCTSGSISIVPAAKSPRTGW